MKALRYWLPAIIWMVVIFILSGRPSVQVSSGFLFNFLFFKTLHLAEYSLLFLLNYRAARNTLKLKSVVLVAFALTIFFAISDEVHQLYVPTREGRTRDVIIDGVGAGLAWLAIRQLLPKAPGKLQELARNWDVI